MRFAFSIAILFSFFTSCSSGSKVKLDRQKLIGSWITVPASDEDERRLKEITTFFPGDSLVTNFYLDEQLQRSVNLTYETDPGRGVIVMNREGRKLEAEVLDLSDRTLILQFVHNGVKRKMERISQ